MDIDIANPIDIQSVFDYILFEANDMIIDGKVYEINDKNNVDSNEFNTEFFISGDNGDFIITIDRLNKTANMNCLHNDTDMGSVIITEDYFNEGSMLQREVNVERRNNGRYYCNEDNIYLGFEIE